MAYEALADKARARIHWKKYLELEPTGTWADIARVMSVNPARIAGLADQGQALAPGSPAHVVLVDPDASVTVDRDASASLSRNNPWHGRDLSSRVVHTVHAGRVTVRDGALA